MKGMGTCGNACTVCPYVLKRKTVQINKKTKWKIERKVNCNTFNCIYMIQCSKDNCNIRYIGQTGRLMKFHIADHIQNQVTSKATGAHCNQPGHIMADMKFTLLEQMKYNDTKYREERDTYLITKFDTFYNGLNKEK